MNVIEGLYLEYRQVVRVANMCAAGFTMPDGSRFRVSCSAAKRYIRKIEERWIAEAEECRPYRLEQHRQAIVNHIRAAKGDKKWSAVSSLSRLLADVDGLIAPQRHRVEHGVDGTVLGLFAGWSTADKVRYAATGEKPGQVDDELPFGPEPALPGGNGVAAKSGNGAGNGSPG